MNGEFIDNPNGPAHQFGHDGRPLWRFRYFDGTQQFVYRGRDGSFYAYRSPPNNPSTRLVGGAAVGALVGMAFGPVGAVAGALIGAVVGSAGTSEDA
jgi:hypothetical protein